MTAIAAFPEAVESAYMVGSSAPVLFEYHARDGAAIKGRRGRRQALYGDETVRDLLGGFATCENARIGGLKVN